MMKDDRSGLLQERAQEAIISWMKENCKAKNLENKFRYKRTREISETNSEMFYGG